MLVIEEDRDVLELIGLTLRRAGLQPLLLGNESLALAYLNAARPDAVVLGLPIRHRQPAELLRRLRRRHPRVPLLILSPEAPRDGDLVYLAKPFSPCALAARLRAELSGERAPASCTEPLH